MVSLLVLPLTLALAAGNLPFAQDRELLERRLAGLRQIFPDGPTAQADIAHLRQLAERAGLGAVDALAHPPIESGVIGHVAIDFSATGRYLDIERFFRLASLSTRLIDVESLTLTGGPEGVIQVKAALRFPFRPKDAPLTRLPDGVHRPQGVAKAVADEYLRHHALAVSKTEAIVRWRRARRNPRLFLAELAAIVRDRPATFTNATLGDEFRVRGLALGAATIQAIERRAERGFFRISDFIAARQGACEHFEIRGASPVAGPEAELPVIAEDPFEQDAAPCRVDRDPARSMTLRTVKGKTAASNTISLRLQDVDATDVFQILAQGTGDAFLVDDDVQGRVSGELVNARPDEVLKALTDLGWSIQRIGRIQWVSVAHRDSKKGDAAEAQQATATSGGSRITLMLKRAELRDVFAALAEVEPSLAALGPQGSFGRASLWASEVPVGDVWTACLTAAGLTEKREEGRVLLERNPGSSEVLVPVAASAEGAPRLVLRAPDVASSEVDLAGLIKVGARGSWQAFSYTPTGSLVSYSVGDKVADGIVRSIESTDMVIEREDGNLHLLFSSR